MIYLFKVSFKFICLILLYGLKLEVSSTVTGAGADYVKPGIITGSLSPTTSAKNTDSKYAQLRQQQHQQHPSIPLKSNSVNQVRQVMQTNQDLEPASARHFHVVGRPHWNYYYSYARPRYYSHHYYHHRPHYYRG